MIGSYSIGSEIIGGGLNFFQPRPLSRNCTYRDVHEQVQLYTKTYGDTLPPVEWYINQISLEVQRAAQREKEWYDQEANFFISGSSNPYWVDLSILNPFIVGIERVVHLAPARTLVEMKTPEEFEVIQKLSSVNAGSIFGCHDGDRISLYAGSSFGMNTKTQRVEVMFYRQPIVSGVTKNNYGEVYLDIPDSQIPFVVEATSNQVLSLDID